MMPKSLKVCHVCAGHSAKDARVFDRACISLAASGYEVHLIAQSEARHSYVDSCVIIHPVHHFLGTLDRFKKSLSIARLAAELGADLYHVHEPALLWPVLMKIRHKPVIWDVHEPFWLYLKNRPWLPMGMGGLASGFWQIAERLAMHRIAAVVTVTEQIADRYRKFHKRVLVIHNFPRIRSSGPAGEQARASNPTCVFTGGMTPMHGIIEAIGALGVLKQRGIIVRLVLAGKVAAGFLEEIKKAAANCGVGEQVTYLGVLSREAALKLQQESTLGLNLSLPHPGTEYGIPSKMIEFLSEGLPIVYSKVPHWENLFAGRPVGIPVDPHNLNEVADAIRRLASDRQLADTLGRNGKTIVREKLNWNAEWPVLKKLYESLIGQ